MDFLFYLRAEDFVILATRATPLVMASLSVILSAYAFVLLSGSLLFMSLEGWNVVWN